MFEAIAELLSTPRGELFTYASRSATRCSSDGEAEGDDVCPNSGDTNAIIPMSNKTRIITRLGYKHPNFSKQGKWRADSQGALERAKNENPPSGWLDQVKILGAVSPLRVKMRLNLERRREAMIETK